jgi:hypothetical protein
MRLHNLLKEEGVGKIVKGVNTTQDVQPGETQRQAAKFGNSVDKDGRPPELHSSARKNSSPNTLFNMGLSEAQAVEPDPTGYQTDLISSPANTIVIDTPGDLDWYKIGQHFPTLAQQDPHEFGQEDSDMQITLANAEELAKLKAILDTAGVKWKDIGGSNAQPEIHEDLGSIPPLADLIILATLAKTSVSAIKAAFKTGKGLLQLKKMADKAGVKLNQAVMGEDVDQEPMSSENYVLASPAGSSYVWLWKNVDGKATPVKQHLTTSEGGKLMKDHGIKWIRYGAQKYFDDLKNVNETWHSNMDKASKKAHADAAEKRKKMGPVTSKTLADINDKLGNNKKKTDEVEQIDEIFGFGKKAQMRRGAVKIATDVMFNQVIKPVLAADFKGVFEGIDIKEDNGKNYIVTGYGFLVNLDVTDQYLAQGKSGDAYYVTGNLSRKLNDALTQKYKEWKSANPGNIHGEMVTSPSVTTTFAANIKNKDGNYEQNIEIRFRVIDGGINKQFDKR